MPSRRTDPNELPLEKIGKGTPLQSQGNARLGISARPKRASLQNRVVVVLRLPIRLALQAERDRRNPSMSMSKFLREVVVREWIEAQGYTAAQMERAALKHVIAEEQQRIDAEEAEETPRYRLEA